MTQQQSDSTAHAPKVRAGARLNGLLGIFGGDGGADLMLDTPAPLALGGRVIQTPLVLFCMEN